LKFALYDTVSNSMKKIFNSPKKNSNFFSFQGEIT